ncbi:MAG: hypothetical protein AAGB11_14145 [Pseudomonadota bacterium]
MFWDQTTLAASGGNGEDGRSHRTASVEPSSLRDLSDFSTNWPELRPEVVSYLSRAETPPKVGEIIHWLVLLADRTCKYEDP